MSENGATPVQAMAQEIRALREEAGEDSLWVSRVFRTQAELLFALKLQATVTVEPLQINTGFPWYKVTLRGVYLGREVRAEANAGTVAGALESANDELIRQMLQVEVAQGRKEVR